MRNRLVSNEGVAQAAGTEVLAQGGNATDAVLAAMLAGATVAGPATLLGSAVLTVAGLGVGAYAVDGRARAPGLGRPRKNAPETPPTRDRFAVPGLIDAVLAGHNRFGAMALSRVCRAAMDAVKDAVDDPQTRARLPVLDAIHRHGSQWITRLGVAQALVEAAGLPVDGVIGRDDFAPIPAPVLELAARALGPHEVLTMPAEPAARVGPPAPPSTPVAIALAADMHGVIASACWALAPEACPIETPYALAGAALNNAPTRGVTRRAPGARIAMPAPLALVRSEARVWAGLAVAGDGALVDAREAIVARRLGAAAGLATDPSAHGTDGPRARGLSFWIVREQGDELRVIEEALSS
jgi:hypothetical protein